MSQRRSSRVSIRTTLEPMYRSVDLQGRVIDCNYKYARMLGYIKDEIIGMSIFDHTPKDQHHVLTGIFERWKAHKPINNRRFPLITKAGVPFDVLVTVEGVFGDDGKVVRSNTTLLDFEEVHQLQNLIKLSKYESLYENSPDMYFTVNVEGVIVDCNRAYEEKMGYTKSEIIGRNFADHVSDRSVSQILINLAQWRVNGVCKSVDVWVRAQDDTEFPVRVTPTNLHAEDGALLGRNVVIQDLTEIQKTQDQLKERKEIEQMKDEFLTGITHELKTPLTPIIGFAQALSKQGMLGDLNKKQEEAVRIIVNNAVHLRKLVMDLLDIHKLELGKMKFDIKEFDLEKMMADFMSSMDYTYKEKRVELTLDMKCKGKVIGDSYRISEILLNLTYNALDFVPPKTGKVHIVVSKDDKYLHFSVTDNGVGIPKDKQSQLFNKFYQVSTTVTRMHGGTGLGLSICKGLVDGMGGSIRVDSTVGVGSKFYFSILQKEVVAP